MISEREYRQTVFNIRHFEPALIELVETSNRLRSLVGEPPVEVPGVSDYTGLEGQPLEDRYLWASQRHDQLSGELQQAREEFERVCLKVSQWGVEVPAELRGRVPEYVFSANERKAAPEWVDPASVRGA